MFSLRQHIGASAVTSVVFTGRSRIRRTLTCIKNGEFIFFYGNTSLIMEMGVNYCVLHPMTSPEPSYPPITLGDHMTRSWLIPSCYVGQLPSSSGSEGSGTESEAESGAQELYHSVGAHTLQRKGPEVSQLQSHLMDSSDCPPSSTSEECVPHSITFTWHDSFHEIWIRGGGCSCHGGDQLYSLMFILLEFMQGLDLMKSEIS